MNFWHEFVSGVDNTETNRREWRELLYTAPGLGQYISGCIMFEETLYQSTADGVPFVKILSDAGILPGIKVDTGLQVRPCNCALWLRYCCLVPSGGEENPLADPADGQALLPKQVLPGTDGETTTQGLDNLPARVQVRTLCI